MRYLYKSTIFLLLTTILCMCAFSVSANETLADTVIESIEEYPTTPIELIIKCDIFEQLDDRNSVIDISAYNLTEEETEKLLYEVIDENAFVINAEIKPEFVVESDCVKQINVEYEELNISLMAVTTMSEEVNNILSCVDDTMTDVEKALAVNDYFVTNYCYDETYSIYTKEGMFTNKTGVCAAYSAAYQYIMKDKLGFQCITVSSDGMNHAWNMLKIDGQWYHVDVTWNDPISDFPGRAVHKYFLLSDNAISDEEHGHYGWVGGKSATSTKYDNYFWSDVETPIIMVDGYYYYITQENGAVCKRNASTGAVSEIYTVSSTWPCWNKPGWHWRGNYSQIAYCDNTLYINTHAKILSMNLSGGNVKTIASQSTSEGYIWGLLINGNKLEYFVSRDRWEYGVEKTKSFIFRHIIGDITCDGKINGADLLRFGKYFAGWNVEIDEQAADVTGDNKVNGLDLLRLGKHFSGWNVNLGK